MDNFLNRRPLWTLFALTLGCGVLSPAHGQLIDRVETKFDGSGGVSGINGARDVALSPDGEHVYVVGSLPVAGGSIAVFSRDNDDLSGTFGQVTFVEAHLDVAIGGLINGLKGPRGVTVSPDGKHVYVAALSDNSVVVFSRNTTVGVGFGELTYVETIVKAGGNGLGGAHGVIVSADGKHVYIASRADDAVTVYSRNETTGMLLHIEAHFEGNAGVSGLSDPERLTLSPDGKHLYVASEGGTPAGPGPGSVAVFSRKTTVGVDFGKLTFVESHIDGVGGADGLLNADDVAVSPDGKHVYVSNHQFLDESEDWIAIFSRDDTTGALTFVSKLIATAADLCSSAFEPGGVASEVVVSPDGRSVIVANSWKGAVVSFSRNAATGFLTIADMECDELGDEGIVTINSVTMSADGKHIYTTGLGAPGSLVVFSGIEITVEFQDTGVEIDDGDITPSDSADEGTDFGALNPTVGMLTRTFDIWNDGIADLTLTGPTPVSLGGADPGQFSVTQPGILVLTPGNKTEFTVTYDPNAEGNHDATLNIASNDTNENPYDFSITGSGVNGTPEITVEFQSTGVGILDGDTSPSPGEGTDFGTFVVAGASATRTFAIRNDGAVNLKLTGPSPVSVAGAGNFGIGQPVQLLLAPGQSTTFAVTFSAANDGVFNATVNLASDDPDENPFNFQVTATNIAVATAAATAAAAAAAAAERASLEKAIKKLKKKIKVAKRRKQTSKAKRLKKKLRKLNARLRAL